MKTSPCETRISSSEYAGQSVDKMLAAAGLSKDGAVHTHIMTPTSLSQDKVNDVLVICANYSPKNIEEIKAFRTYIDCKVEITCLASRSPRYLAGQ